MRMHNKNLTPCYIPKINNVPILNGYVLKESINLKGETKDNIKLAEFFLEDRVKKLEKDKLNINKYYNTWNRILCWI